MPAGEWRSTEHFFFELPVEMLLMLEVLRGTLAMRYLRAKNSLLWQSVLAFDPSSNLAEAEQVSSYTGRLFQQRPLPQRLGALG